MRKRITNTERRYFMDYARSELQVARGWRESASHARKTGDRRAAQLFSKAAREAARSARQYAAQARGRKSIFTRTRRSR